MSNYKKLTKDILNSKVTRVLKTVFKVHVCQMYVASMFNINK